MKNIKKSILSKTALIALFSIIGSYTYANHDETNREKIHNLSMTFTSVEGDLSQFVDSSNKTPFNIFVIKLRTTLQNLQREIETLTRGHGDELATDIDRLMDYSLQQFNILYDVFKKYNGKSAAQAKEFGEEIRRQFDTDKIFAEMISKLKVLRTKALHAGDKNLVKQIEDLAKKIQQKKTIWTAKTDLSLFLGLTKRMQC